MTAMCTRDCPNSSSINFMPEKQTTSCKNIVRLQADSYQKTIAMWIKKPEMVCNNNYQKKNHSNQIFIQITFSYNRLPDPTQKIIYFVSFTAS